MISYSIYKSTEYKGKEINKFDEIEIMNFKRYHWKNEKVYPSDFFKKR